MTGSLAHVKAATSDAWIARRERTRRARMLRHVVVGIAASVGLVAISTFPISLPGYVARVVLVGIALDAFARALDAKLGWGWGWVYGDPDRLTRLDRLAEQVVARIPRPESPVPKTPPGRVRVLPPQ